MQKYGNRILTRQKRIGQQKYNNNGELMEIVDYKNSRDITIKFEDGTIMNNVNYWNFMNGRVKKYNRPNKYNKGVNPVNDGSRTKEYSLWDGIMNRCFSNNKKVQSPSYLNVTCCNEWLDYKTFCEWLHSQSNWEKCRDGEKWAIDKDIIRKGNKIYSPLYCCLVPHNVNSLFTKHDRARGLYPIGVTKKKTDKYFTSRCNDPFNNKTILHYGFATPEDAFMQYKKDKEMIIKKVAQSEYDKGNITLDCYKAMLNYMVEITD